MTIGLLPGLEDLRPVQRRGDTLVLRARARDGAPVLVKTHASDLPTDASRERLRREHQATTAVRHRHLVTARDLVDTSMRVALVLDDPPGPTWAEAVTAGAIDLVGVLDVAIAVGSALAALHARGVVHRAVDGEHVVLGPDGPVLVDLYDASESGVRPRRSSHGSHLAPEQRGPEPVPADAAIDRYALGATTQALLAALGPIPDGLAVVLDRATHPDPRRRHRSVLGLVADLRAQRRHLVDGGPSPAPSDDEVALRWEDPRQVVGRDDLRSRLVAAADAVAAAGQGRVVVVRGQPGSGRTALVRAVADDLRAKGVLCGTATMSDPGATVAFRAGATVMTQLVDQLLTAPEPVVRAVEGHLRRSLGDDLAVATQVLPALGLVVGPQPEPPHIDPSEALGRVTRATRASIAAVARHLPPAVGIFDDGDLGDATFMGALESVGGHPDAGPFLVVVVTDGSSGALRDLIARVAARGAVVEEVEVAPLAPDDVAELIAQGTGMAAPAVAELADAVWRRSGGLPRVALADLWTLVESGDLWIDVDAGVWRWSERARRVEAPLTLAEVAGARVRDLAPDALTGAAIVAVAGRAARVPVVARVLGIADQAAAAVVDRAVVAHVLAPASPRGELACLDDGVRDAVLAALDATERAELEQRVARAVLATADEGPDGHPDLADAHRIDVIDLLRRDPTLATDPDARQLLVGLCEDAARAAHRAGAFQEALDLQRTAIEALGEQGWQTQPERAFELHLRAAEHALVVGRPELVDELLDAIGAHDPSAPQRVRTMRVLGMRAWTRQDHDGGLEHLRLVLAELGEPLPARPTWRDVAVEAARTHAELGRFDPEWFLTAPALEDERLLATLDAMLGCVHLAYVDQPLTHILLVLRGTRLTARHGVADASGYFIAAYGMLCVSLPGATPRGLRFGRVAAELGSRGRATNATMVGFAVDAFVRHWGEPLDATVDPLLQRYRATVASGARGYGLTGGTFGVLHGLLAARPLQSVEATADAMAEELDAMGERAFRQRVDVVAQAVADLRTGGDGDVLDGPAFSAPEWLAAKRRGGELAVIVHTLRALVALSHDRRDVAAEAVAAAAPLLRSAPGEAVVGVHRFQAALIAADALAAASGASSRARRRAELARARARLRALAEHAPANHAHRLALVDAVTADASGSARRAMDRYEEAVRLATEHGALGDLGLAAQRAARHHRDRGRDRLARHYASVAQDAWLAWGADAVAAGLPARLPGLVSAPMPDAAAVRPGADPGRVPVGQPSTVAAETLAEASTLLGEGLEVRDFLQRMVDLVMRQAGATRGYLVLHSPAGPVVEAAAQVRNGVVEVVPRPSPDPAEHPGLSPHALHYVLRTRQVLALVDPADDRRLRADEALRERAPRALLGLPIGGATGTPGAFVLESDDRPDGVEPTRVSALRVLAAQAISAVEHARLTSDLGALAQDVADLRSTADSMSTLAETDALTGVANRLGLESALRSVMDGTARPADAAPVAGEGPRVGVLFCDLDGFKGVNDRLGHTAGDAALVEVARRLRAAVRSDDVVARLGGDEFVVVSIGVSDEELAQVAERIRVAVAQPIDVGAAAPVSLGVSIGVGRADMVGVTSLDDVDALLGAADDSMYRAKRSGGNRVVS
ncbi:diguanylate cyclase [Iamia sp. SCSIO 61187]|uniref:diguanylate cyclase n=1 Tax=Iamia sp. SCSIO 61187 TaxID=2722752 RepID=UPI001C6277A5|nr:diguanylate cyclase [Iamia sp. SCSIO 61187]QYG94639.1 diguanylate cyclase [Iamia sp. SCSIO 61187]